MSNRLNHVRKNLEARRKNLNYRIKQKERSAPAAFNRQKYSKGEAGASTHSNIRGGKPVLEDKGFFLLRIMIAVILFLCVGILFKNGSTQLEPVRQFVSNAIAKSFSLRQLPIGMKSNSDSPLHYYRKILMSLTSRRTRKIHPFMQLQHRERSVKTFLKMGAEF